MSAQLALCRTPREDLPQWPLHAEAQGTSVETIVLQGGIRLILSRMAAGGRFRFEEPEDAVGVGFHLRGGARFDLEGHSFETRALDAWAVSGPRGSSSAFRLPEHGFQTVSLRFTPNALSELLDRYGLSQGGPLATIARNAETEVASARLTALDAPAVQLIHMMFAAPYTGTARALFLESAAFALLATQFDSADTRKRSRRARTEDRLMAEARARLDQQLESPPSIVELARAVGVNEFKLKRGFKARFGTTIFGYVRQRRMERAAAHLRGGLSVAAAAESVGYSCPRCFADAFRRHFGLLPSEFTRNPGRKTPAPCG